MSTLPIGPCTLDGWQPDESCLKLPSTVTPEQRQFWQRIAAEVLYIRTGMRFGKSCEVTVRPCYGGCNGQDGDGWWFSGPVPLGYNGPFYPYRGADGGIRNWRGCGCGDRCHCGPQLCQLELPGPIFDINEVVIDGTVLDRNTYFAYDGRFLVLHTEDFKALHPTIAAKYGDCWPTCQDLTKPARRMDTFSVTYSTGLASPFMAQAAVTELMNHFAGMCDGCGCGTEARQNLSRLSRQGVDLEFADPQQVFTDDRIGLPISDLFVQTYNPAKLPRAMRVFSPDMKRRPRVEQGF